jgi:peptide subunit release factor 1 (eRF1)
MEQRKFKCEQCNEEFISERSMEEALKEKQKNFIDMPIEDMACVCSDCFEAIMWWNKHARKLNA